MFVRNRLRLVLFCCTWLLLVAQGLVADDVVPGEQESSPVIDSADQQAEPDSARERELGAEEDPHEKEKAVEEARVSEIVKRGDLSFYGSARMRYRDVDTESIWSDGGSRFGLTGGWRINPQLRIFGRGEAGINLLDEFDFLLNRGDRPQGQNFADTVFVRLLHVGVESPGVTLTAGKNWSTYYRVSSFTDRFQGTGASASGTYNAGTDGGYTGTGRADRVLQGRFSVDTSERKRAFKPLGLGLQIQHGEPIPQVPGKNYNTTVGLSTIYESENGLAIGAAYNHASIDDADLIALRPTGIDGDAKALVVGARWYGERWYVGTVVSRLENHETTDQDIYFDGTGWEVYSQYRVVGPWWAIAGWNKLKPDAAEVQAGAFRIDYGILGIRYSFQDLRQFLYANVQLQYGTSQAGQERGDVYTIGVRWDLP